MQLLLSIIYQFLKLLVRGLIWVYYSKVELRNEKWNHIKGPCIVVSNHPSTLMDPLNAVVNLHRQVNFLANASLFGSKFSNWFFSTFYCIKVERYKDTGGKPLNNVAAFRQSIEFMTKGGCLYIAPEGSSYEGRRVNKLKTGLARIAFQTEQENNFELGLQILPIGLNYKNPYQFRQPLLVNLGEPFKVADFQKDWEQDNREAVRKLTLHLKEKMEGVILTTIDEKEDALLAHLEEMRQNDEPLSLTDKYDRSQSILSKLKILRESKPDKLDVLAMTVTDFFEKMKSLNITDAAVSVKKTISFWRLVLTLPFVIVGLVIHFLPCFIVKKLSDALSSDPVWIPTYKVCGGLVLYPLIIFLEYKLWGWWCSSLGDWEIYFKWAFIIAIIPCGLVAEWFFEQWTLLKSKHRFRKLNQELKKELLNTRIQILNSI